MTVDRRAGEHARRPDLTRRSVQGVLWLALSGGGQAALQVALLVVLARLITPQEFGIVAAALVVVALTTVFAEAGIGPALVQREDVTRDHVRVGFTFQFVVSVGLWALLVIGAETVAGIFRMDVLRAVVPAITSVLVIRSLSLGDFLLQRELAFRRLATVEFVSWVLGYATVVVVLAVRGYGLWAIVAGNVSQAVLRTVLLWWAAPHPVRPLWDGRLLRELLTFGGGYTLAWWANFAARQGDNVVVGRWLGADMLGLYTRAYSLMRHPATLLGTIVSRVLFPAMAAVQHDRPRLRRTYLRSVSLVAMLVIPVSAVAAINSTELVLVLLGPRWLGLRDAFTVMVCGMLFRTSSKLSDAVTSATGHVYQRAARQAIYAVLIVSGAMIGRSAGIEGVAWGIVVALLGNFLLMARLTLRLTDGHWRQFARAHVAGSVLAAVIAGPVWLATSVMRTGGTHPTVILVTATAIAGGVAVLAVRVAPSSRPGRSLAGPLTGVLRNLSPGPRGHRTLRRLLGAWYVDAGRHVETLP